MRRVARTHVSEAITADDGRGLWRGSPVLQSFELLGPDHPRAGDHINGYAHVVRTVRAPWPRKIPLVFWRLPV